MLEIMFLIGSAEDEVTESTQIKQPLIFTLWTFFKKKSELRHRLFCHDFIWDFNKCLEQLFFCALSQWGKIFYDIAFSFL